VGKVDPAHTAELQFGPDKEDRYKYIAHEDEYCFAWGTTVKSQISRIVPAADSYDLRFEMYTHHKITRALATWRASAVIPMREAQARSPQSTPPTEEAKGGGGLLEAIIKSLKGE
jgi:hypothetical protein